MDTVPLSLAAKSDLQRFFSCPSIRCTLTPFLPWDPALHHPLCCTCCPAAAMGSEVRLRKKNLKRKRTRSELESESFNSLPWSSALPVDANDPAFSLFMGSNELDGGQFHSLLITDLNSIPCPSHCSSYYSHTFRLVLGINHQVLTAVVLSGLINYCHMF